jgi:hypothetical protein
MLCCRFVGMRSGARFIFPKNDFGCRFAESPQQAYKSHVGTAGHRRVTAAGRVHLARLGGPLASRGPLPGGGGLLSHWDPLWNQRLPPPMGEITSGRHPPHLAGGGPSGGRLGGGGGARRGGCRCGRNKKERGIPEHSQIIIQTRDSRGGRLEDNHPHRTPDPGRLGRRRAEQSTSDASRDLGRGVVALQPWGPAAYPASPAG